jgi:hypothetical protein
MGIRALSWKTIVAGGALALLLLAMGFGPSPGWAGEYGHPHGGGGGGVGVGIGIGVGTILLNEAIRHRQERHEQVDDGPSGCTPPMVYSRKARGCISKVAKCDPPQIYSKKAHGCIDKPTDVTDCAPPMLYSKKAHGCIDKPTDVTDCEPPMVYSKKAHGCVKRDEPHVASCEWPFVKAGNGCACADGYALRDGECIKPPIVVIEPAHEEPVHEPLPPARPPHATPPPEEVAQPKPSATPVALLDDTTSRCLPQDLFDLLQDTYGKRPGLKACPSACLPKPASFSPVELNRASAKHKITWCEDCVQVGAYMPLAAALKLEKLANVTICANPDLCAYPTRVIEHAAEIHTVFKDLPAGVKNEGNLAVVVGNENYQGEVPKNANGKSDADAVMALLIDQLGYKKENIIDLRDATLADFERVFGSDANPGGEIAKRIDKQNPGDVFIYVASHGMVKEDDGKLVYLLPVDAKIDDLDKTAYGLPELYDNLGKTGARTTMLVLEANFAKNLDELIDPPNLPELEVEAMPGNPVPGLAVFKASDRDQRAIQDPEYGIGLFTRYLIEGLAGRADESPLGNGDKRIDTVELFIYTSDAVREAARKSFGLEQKPLLSKIDNLVVGNLTER